jgi:hypothetical protein
MEFNEEIVFGGGIDTDSEARAVARGDYRDAKYTINGNTYGSAFAMTNLRGTIQLTNPDVTEADRIAGWCIWPKNGYIIYFVSKAISDDEIWYYDSLSGGGGNNLICSSADFNFGEVIHAEVIGDILKWTDGVFDSAMWVDSERVFNPPFQINLQKAIDGDYSAIDYQVINVIKFPPQSPKCVYVTDDTHADNKLRRKLFRFRVRYIYENEEQTVWSVVSNLAIPTQSEFVSGSNWVDSNSDNAIDVSFDTGPDIVKKIEVCVQQMDENGGGAETQFGVFLQIDKALEGVADNDTYTYRFFGNVSSKPISNAIKNYDRVPITALCQTILPTSQVAYTNIREGYDKIELQTTIEPIYNEIEWTPDYANVYSAFDYSGVSGLMIAIDSVLAEDDIFDCAVGDTWSYSIHVASPSDEFIVLTYTVSQNDYDNALLEATNLDKQYYINGRMTAVFVEQINAALGGTIVEATEQTIGLIDVWVIDQVAPNVFTVDTDSNRLFTNPVKPNRPTRVVPSLKVGATHKFGIVYMDEGYRDGTVLTDDSLSLFVPWYTDLDLSAFTDPNNPFYTTARLTIQHKPPVWARYYTIVAQKATEIASFGHWIIDAGFNGSTPGTAIQPDGDRYKIYLDKFYTETNVGATINHQIQVGDVARFYRKRLDVPTAGQVDTTGYLTDFFEMEVLDYAATTSDSDGRQVIWVERFNANLIDPSVFSGQTIEIYTPRPSLDTSGDLFVSPWREVTPILEIGDAHSPNAYHDVENTSGIGRVDWQDDSVSVVYFEGNWNGLVGWTFEAIVEGESPASGTITAATLADGLWDGYTLITFTGTSFGDGIAGQLTWTAWNGQVQVVENGVVTTPAILNLGYGDVYVRQRNYATGANAPQSCYFFIEDPHYSDYWLSDFHQYGRFQVENPNGKMVHRVATSIHSDAYIINSEINGTCSFSILNDNILDMNPTFGEVLRTYLSGREGKTMKCLQPMKENSIYIQNYPTDVQVPTGELKIKQETFAAWYPYKSNIGCSDPWSVVQLPSGESIYFDRIGGYFVYSATNGQVLISEIDPVTRNNFKFRKKTKELRQQLIADSANFIRTYVDENNGLAGFGFAIASIPSATGNLVYAQVDETEITVEGDVDALTALIGQEITFYIQTDDPENPYVIFTTTIVDVVGGFIGIAMTVSDPFPLTANFGGYYEIKTVYNYDTVIFDYINMRWRSRVDYPFVMWSNYGNVLVGWNKKNEMFLHNQDSFTFHGENVSQEVTVVSNENPLLLKRYQDVIERSDKTWGVEAYAEPNQSYTEMATEMPDYLFNLYEGYSLTDYRKNKFTPLYASEEMAMMNGEDVRANALTHRFYRALDSNCVLFSFGIKGVLS